MQTPQRKLGKFAHLKPDPNITQVKATELKVKLEKLINFSRPPAIKEVRRLAEMGDFSENHAYQIAKGRLRGINKRITDIEDHLKRAIIINPSAKKDIIKLGHTVTIEMNGKQKQYTILGSGETDPSHGIISHNSTIGSALLDKRVGDVVEISLSAKKVDYKILKIE